MSGYWHAVWPAEDGGPRRLQHVEGPGLDVRAGELTVTSRPAFGAHMVVQRDRDELYFQGAVIGPDSTAWVERIDPRTLEPLERVEDLAAGPWWPGGILAHSNGDLYVTQGRWCHRLASDLSVVRSRELPRDRPYNSLLAQPDGSLVMKDMSSDDAEPTQLVVLDPDEAWIEEVRASLPPLPAARRRRLAEATGQAADAEAVMVVTDRGQDDYVVAVAQAGGDAGRALVHVKEAFAEAGTHPGVPAGDLAALTRLEVDGALTATQAKQVLAELVAAGGGDPAAIAAAKGFEAMDTGALEALVDRAIAEQPDAWEKFCGGENKAMGALVGAVMKASKGKADGKAVTALLNSKKR